MLANSIALLAAVMWGFSYAIGARLLQVYPAPFLLIVHAVATLLVMLPFTLWQAGEGGGPWQAFSEGRMLPLLLAEVAFALLANLLIYTALGKGNPVVAALIETTYPVFIVAAAFVLFQQNLLTLPTAVGGALIFAGVAVMTLWG